jgi:hypothetical protein
MENSMTSGGAVGLAHKGVLILSVVAFVCKRLPNPICSRGGGLGYDAASL